MNADGLVERFRRFQQHGGRAAGSAGAAGGGPAPAVAVGTAWAKGTPGATPATGGARAGADGGVERQEWSLPWVPVTALSAEWASRLAGSELGPPSGWRWLDLEATGLHGAGVRAFLAGVGRAEGSVLHVRQFLLADPAGEAAFLEAVLAEFAGASAVVTFNGRTFDWPLLRDRAVLSGLGARMPDLPHWDVLPAARRVWGEWLGASDLATLDAALLGGTRQGEPPGHLAAALYGAYLEGDRGALEGLRSRNRRDVVALVGVAAQLCALLAGAAAGTPAVLLGLARLLERLGETALALRRYREALERAAETPRVAPAVRRAAAAGAARLLKRLGRGEEALPLWEDLAGGAMPSLDAVEELAKHLEHRRRDAARALAVVRRALHATPWMTEGRRGALQRRQRRLERKVARPAGGRGRGRRGGATALRPQAPAAPGGDGAQGAGSGPGCRRAPSAGTGTAPAPRTFLAPAKV